MKHLGNKIGVTIIATGFEHKDPFKPAPKPKEEKKPEEKIVLHLGVTGEEKKLYTQPSLALEDKDPYAPTMVEMPDTGPAIIQPSLSSITRNSSTATGRCTTTLSCTNQRRTLCIVLN